MYTDKAYLVKDRFHEKVPKESLSVLYSSPSKPSDNNDLESNVDPDQYPATYGIEEGHTCPPGLEKLCNLTKVYLYVKLNVLENDTFGIYKGELVNEDGDRILVISTAPSYDSDEVIRYDKHTIIKRKGKICYGVINYAGVQVFEVYGHPENVIRIGPGVSIWGEIQLISKPKCYHDENCCDCLSKKNKSRPPATMTIRVVVMKKDSRVGDGYRDGAYKQVYTLHGNVQGGMCHEEHTVFYRKKFDLSIYPKDFSEGGERKPLESEYKEVEPIGRICSSEFHKKLECHLPLLEVPQSMNVYEKLTLMGTFFMFHIKI